ENTAEYGYSVRRAACARRRLAEGRRILPQADQGKGRAVGAAGHGRGRAVRQVEGHAARNHTRRHVKLGVFSEGAARTRRATGSSQYSIRIAVGEADEVQAGLGIAVIQIMRHQQPMALRSYVTDLQNQVLGDLALDRQVVLLGILRPKVGQELAEEQNRPEA